MPVGRVALLMPSPTDWYGLTLLELQSRPGPMRAQSCTFRANYFMRLTEFFRVAAVREHKSANIGKKVWFAEQAALAFLLSTSFDSELLVAGPPTSRKVREKWGTLEPLVFLDFFFNRGGRSGVFREPSATFPFPWLPISRLVPCRFEDPWRR